MAILLESTKAEDESEEWTTTGPFLLQASTKDGSRVLIELLVKTADTAPWVSVGSCRPDAVEGAILSWPHEPPVTAKVRYYGNIEGDPVKIWRTA